MNSYRSWFDDGTVEISEVRLKFGVKGNVVLEEMTSKEACSDYLVVFLRLVLGF